MAQPVNATGGDLKAKPRTSSRVSNALKTGVVYGSSAVLTAVNNITPHIAGAVDILVIEQPDGSRKATPFYVRFGKYTALRTRERNVKLYINDELAPFGMHIGMYGQAYFATETVEVREGDDDEQEALLAGMMSPPSGYSSGADEPSAHHDRGEAGATLSAVRQRIDGMKYASGVSGRIAAGAGGGSRAPRVPLPALGGGSPHSPAEAAAAVSVFAERSTGAYGSQQPAPPLLVQLAPAMSMADRNESFLSARETLATPLGDELIASALGFVSPALPASPDRQLQPRSGSQTLLQSQGQGARAAVGSSSRLVPQGGSTNSLGTVSEGASPCGWSEEGDEEEEREGASPPTAGAAAVGQACTQQQQEQPVVAAAAHLDQQHQFGSQNHLHQHSGLQQPLHQQLGFPENSALVAAAADSECGAAATASDPVKDQAAVGVPAIDTAAAAPQPPISPPAGLGSGCPGPLESHAGGPKLHAAVDWAQVLGPAAGSGARHGAGAAAALPAGGQSAAAHDAAAPRQVSCSAYHQRASPGAGPGGLAAALSHDGHGPSSVPGSGPGSHSAVSLLSSSLRSGGGSGAALGGLDGRLGVPAGGRSGVDRLRARGQATAEPQPPSAFLQLPAAAAALSSGGLPLGGLAGEDGPVGPIAAAVAAAGRPMPADAAALPALQRAAQEPSGEHSVSLYLSVTNEGEVRVQLTASQLPPLGPSDAIGPERASRDAVGCGGGGGGGAVGAAPQKDTLDASDSGYLGDVEGATAVPAAGAPVRHHQQGSHHHYHYNQGQGRLRLDHYDELLHSTSAPLPSSAMNAAGAAAAAAEASGGAGPSARAAPAAHGIELSLCGNQLTTSMLYAEASALFDAHRLSEDLFFTRAQHLAGGSELAIRLSNGVIFPCQPLSYSLLGLLAFGAWRLPPGTPCWAPEGADAAGESEAAATSAAAAAAAAMLAAAVAQSAGVAAAIADTPKNGGGAVAGAVCSAATTPKKGQAGTGTGSWRLWMFGTRREGGRTSSATGVGVSGGSAYVSGRSPPLTSPISERQGLIEHRSAGAEVAAPLPLPPLLPAIGTLPHTAAVQMEGAVAAADSSVGGGLPPAGGSASRDSSHPREAAYNVVTKKSLTPTAEQLAALPLKHGQNTIMYKVGASELRAYVYFLPWRTRIVISDIDGTITKSDVLGHLLPAMGLDWSHAGIAQLLTNIRHNNYLIMYLSSRSISQANITRDFINTLVQGEHRMPLGPVIISPHGLLPSLYREMILRRPHEFKIATLQDIRALFPRDWNPFYSGFGNRDTDEISYREVGVPPSRIFIINPRGELRQPIEAACRAALGAACTAAASLSATGYAKAQGGQEDAAADGGGGGGKQVSDVAAQPLPPLPSQSPTAASAAGGAAAPAAAAGGGTREAHSRSLGTVSAPVVAAAATRDVSSRSVGSVGSVGRRTSGSVAATAATVALSTLSAINDLVHDIFPPLRAGKPVTSSSSSSSSSEDEGPSGLAQLSATSGRQNKGEASGRSSADSEREGAGEDKGGAAPGAATRWRRSGSATGGAGGDADARPVGSGRNSSSSAASGRSGGEGEGGAASVSEAVKRDVRGEGSEERQLASTLAPPAATPQSAASPRSSTKSSYSAPEAEGAPADRTAVGPAAPPGARPSPLASTLLADDAARDSSSDGAAAPSACAAGVPSGALVAGKIGTECGSGAPSCARQPTAASGGCNGGGSPGGGVPAPTVMEEVVATAVPLPA